MSRPSYRKGKDGEAESHPSELVGIPLTESTTWKTELTRELLETLVQSSRVLTFRKEIALANGVRPDLLDWWLSEGLREDAPPLMQELSVRLQSVQAIQNMSLVNEVQKVAARGEWQAAMLLLTKRSPQWSGKMETPEKELSEPELSLKDREVMLIGALKNAKGHLRAALIEALKNPDSGLLEVLQEAGLATKALPK